ncbi:HsdM family class I SAM-dependent methyltransferase [Polyangium aurulentum]|uniref:HsdM family class I SAM-dependent methyltransferase n=1 Tax=Polyangium aurulentum TaxID=2567896 RepID=UPI0019820438|nr:N-6 DNA methylase [Polyangium aurulentum]UQA60207.1 N-6 DNA methylase [Polyangium aurulentum]
MRPPPITSGRLGPEAMSLAVQLGDAAATMEVEDAAYLVGSTYAAMLPAEVRAERGVYYTPPPVVRRLLDAAEKAGVDWAVCRVLDPACGGGAFLGPVAERMINALRGCDRRMVVRNIATHLQGFEIDRFAAWISQVFLESTLHLHLGGSSKDIAEAVEVCDSLTRHESAQFDLVVGNPPYGRVTLGAAQRAIYQRSLYGHANQYGLFLDLAMRKTRPDGGVIAYVTPTSFLSGEYFKRLRGLLSTAAPPESLDFIAERTGVFDDVLQETLLAVFRRGGNSGRVRVHFVVATETSLTGLDAGEVPLPSEPEAPWILPRSAGATGLASQLHALPNRISDWGYGVSTGPLVWNRYKDRLRAKPQRGTVPLIWAEAVSADGSFAFRASRRNHLPYFAVREGDDFLLVRRPCVLLQRTTSKEQPRRLVAAELPESFLLEHGGVTIENHLNMVVPLVETPAVDTVTLAAFLNSGAADRAFRCISGSVAVSAYELEAMPVPSASAMQALSTLLRRQPSQGEIERLCNSLYGER